MRYLLFDIEADVIAPAAIHVQACGNHLGDHADRRACPVDPAHEAGVQIAGGVGDDVAPEIVQHLAKIVPRARQGLPEPVARRRRRRLPDGPLPDCLDMRDHIVQHGMREASEFAPVRRIEIAAHATVRCVGRAGWKRFGDGIAFFGRKGS